VDLKVEVEIKTIISENKTSEKTTAIKVLEAINPASGTIISTDPLMSKRDHTSHTEGTFWIPTMEIH
jgi:hypothetical protein